MLLNRKTKNTQKKYDRLSKYYDFFESGIERRLFSKLRKRIIPKLDGDILEIGVGTGKNIPYYNSMNTRINAIDISSKMMKKAKKLSKKQNLNIQFHMMDAQKLDFDDESFDYVLGTFVLCSIPDPILSLKEARRVLKKEGKIIFIEHVLSNNKIISLFQHLHNPITKFFFGFNVNRDTKKNIQESRIKIIKDEKLYLFDIFRYFRGKK